jgi:hypothetical protein
VPLLGWEPVPDAAGYRVVVALDRDFTNHVVGISTPSTWFVPPETYDDNGPAGSYYWFATPATTPT